MDRIKLSIGIAMFLIQALLFSSMFTFIMVNKTITIDIVLVLILCIIIDFLTFLIIK